MNYFDIKGIFKLLKSILIDDFTQYVVINVLIDQLFL